MKELRELVLEVCRNQSAEAGKFNCIEVWTDDVFDKLDIEGEDLFYSVNNIINELEEEGVIVLVDGTETLYRLV